MCFRPQTASQAATIIGVTLKAQMSGSTSTRGTESKSSVTTESLASLSLAQLFSEWVGTVLRHSASIVASVKWR